MGADSGAALAGERGWLVEFMVQGLQATDLGAAVEDVENSRAGGPRT